jgi:hypothetical protein
MVPEGEAGHASFLERMFVRSLYGYQDELAPFKKVFLITGSNIAE